MTGLRSAPSKPPAGIEVISLDDDHDVRPDTEADTNPHWLWALVGDGGVRGQQVWVRYYAEAAPAGVPVLRASHRGPSVRVVNDGSSTSDDRELPAADAVGIRTAIDLLNAAAAVGRAAANQNGKTTPAGMSAWVTSDDVRRLVQVSKSKANEYLRAAAGRRIGTGELLRVPVDVWEEWARTNLISGKRKRWASEGHSQRPATSTSGGASGGAGSTTTTVPSVGSPPAQPTRRRLGPGSPNGSVRPLIPTLSKPKP